MKGNLEFDKIEKEFQYTRRFMDLIREKGKVTTDEFIINKELQEDNIRELLASLTTNDVLVFTDGSAFGNPGPTGAGGAVYLNGYNAAPILLKKGVSKCSNSFTGELVGIQISLEFLEDTCDVENRNIHIFTDCQAAIVAAFQNQIPKNKIEIVTSIKQHILNINERGNKIHVHWVPGHKDIEGNELADQQAKSGAREMESAQDDGGGMSIDKKEVVAKIKQQIQEKWELKFRMSEKMDRIQEIFFQVGKRDCFGEEDRASFSALNQILCGYSRLNGHLAKIIESQSELCKECGVPETVEHYMFDCDLFNEERKELEETVECILSREGVNCSVIDLKVLSGNTCLASRPRMIFSIGFLLLEVIRWIGKTRRRSMFRKVLSKAVSGSSLYVQKRVIGSQALSTKFIYNGGNFQEKPLTVCNRIIITAICPMHTIDLSEWTSYMKVQGKDTRVGSDTDLTVLLEAVRPDNMKDFLQHQLDLSQADKISVLSHGCATAWMSGSPFGIIYHCSFEELVTLTVGMEDGFLAVNEDLEVISLKTVNTIGKPSSLIEPIKNQTKTESKSVPQINVTPSKQMSQEAQSELDIDHLATDLAHTLSGEHESVLETWSNESLASNSSVGKVELLDPSENDLQDDNKGETDFVEGSGEGLSELTGDDFNNDDDRVSKPPNVLIYTGKTDTVRKFDKVKTVLQQCLDPDCYVIYHLKHEEIETSPWIENTSLLVVSGAKITKDQTDIFLQYFYGGGKILSLDTDLDSSLVHKIQIRKERWMSEIAYDSWRDVALVCSRFVYDLTKKVARDVNVIGLACDKDKNTVMVKVMDASNRQNGCAILSQVLLEADAADLGVTPEIFNQLKKSNVGRFEILTHILDDLGLECSRKSPKPLTAAGLVTKSQEIKDTFLMSIEKRLNKGVLKSGAVSLLFTKALVREAEELMLPIVTGNTDDVCVNFDTSVYMENLQTEVLGNTVIYVDVVPTTMPLLDGMMFSVPKDVGLVAIARQQTSGKGRGGNSWLSPIGCAMHTLHVKVPLESNLGKCVSFLQHITSLAVVYSVCKMDGYEDINLRLKWPNDIYYGQVMKLGGVIVKSTVLDGVIHAVIGCGFNVDNSNPTICINDIIQSYNRQFGTQLSSCTTEQLLGRTITWIEKLVASFQEHGADWFKQAYYEKWLHSDATVTLQTEGNLDVKIIGLDEYGYLLVQKDDRQTISVQPDGNSFDMMKNLITWKTR